MSALTARPRPVWKSFRAPTARTALLLTLTACALGWAPGSVALAAGPCPSGQDDAGWTLSTTTYGTASTRHPYVGNGYLSQRVPPAGMGYVATGEPTGWPLYTPRYDGAFVGGLYGRDPLITDIDGQSRTVDAAIPTWSTLSVTAGRETYSPATPGGASRTSASRCTSAAACCARR